MEHHRHHHHGGIALFIAMSLDTLGVSPEQQAAIEKVHATLHEKLEPVRLAEQDLIVTLADGAAAGNVDTAKVDTELSRVTAAAVTVHDASAEALNALHSILTPFERAALIDKVESHWAVWRQANSEEPGPGASGEGYLDRFATDLGLTTDQLATIRTRLHDGSAALPPLDTQEIDTYLHAFGAAFESEQFDARVALPGRAASAHMAAWGASHMAHFVETVSPVLSPDQRVLFAQRLREHASHTESPVTTP
jgi:Spy/CpxP family protein refolding chaperone